MKLNTIKFSKCEIDGIKLTFITYYVMIYLDLKMDYCFQSFNFYRNSVNLNWHKWMLTNSCAVLFSVFLIIKIELLQNNSE